jgi:hypothetical protein
MRNWKVPKIKEEINALLNFMDHLSEGCNRAIANVTTAASMAKASPRKMVSELNMLNISSC